jgi:hypothetical protein
VEVTVALSEKDRAKRASKAAKLLPPGTTVRALAQGSGHFRITTPAIVILVVFGIAFLYALSRGFIIIPGVLVIFGVWGECRPGRDLLATDRGLAVMHRSKLTGRTNKVIALLPPAPLYAGTPRGPVELVLGPEQIKLTRKEFDRLAAAMSHGSAMSTPADAVDWAPSAAPTDWTPPATPGPY